MDRIPIAQITESLYLFDDVRHKEFQHQECEISAKKLRDNLVSCFGIDRALRNVKILLTQGQNQ
ncbi:MAG: hypothetical protein HC849_29920 [Oscillatoriales cyanobacterium RU_3_3]|nr:hypothetical protein [Oscillatoriales cyanobacterium RU_3_3]